MLGPGLSDRRHAEQSNRLLKEKMAEPLYWAGGARSLSCFNWQTLASLRELAGTVALRRTRSNAYDGRLPHSGYDSRNTSGT